MLDGDSRGVRLSKCVNVYVLQQFVSQARTTLYIHLIVTYLAPDHALMFVLRLIRAIYPERKPNKMHLGHQAINQPCQWAKIGDFT